jgi:hypothetical protein
VLKDGSLGPERAVANRQIREDWTAYAEREAAKRRARLDGEARELAERRRRAKNLLEIVPALRHAGIEDSTHRVWGGSTGDGKFVSALENAGLLGDILTKDPESERGLAWGDQYTLRCPLARQMEDYVVRGSSISFRESDLFTLLKIGV